MGQALPVGRTQRPSMSLFLAVGLSLALGLLALGLAFAWTFVYTGFRPYDDEGYLMISVQEFLNGKRLYDDVFTQYGPFYYFSYGLYHSRAFAGLSHDSVRLATALVWLATAAGCALLATRVAGKAVAAGAVAAFALTMVILKTLANEPGHPQELCILLTVLVLLTTTLANAGGRVLPSVLGALVAALAMTKINVGVFAAAGVLLALLASERGNRLLRAAAFLVATGVVVLPLVLMRDYLTSWGLACCIFVDAAMLPMVAIAIAGPVPAQPTAKMVPWFLGSLAFVIVTLATAILAMGTTPKALWHGLYLQPMQFARVYSSPPAGLTNQAAALTVPGMVIGLAYAWGIFRSPLLIRWLKIAYLVSLLVLMIALRGRHLDLLLFYGLPWAWLVLAIEPSVNSEGLPVSMPTSRMTLGLFTPLMVLQAYPVAGSQVHLAMVPLLVGASVCGADFLRSLDTQSWPRRIGVVVVCLLSLASLGGATYISVKAYIASEPLGLPGASRVRLEAEHAATYRWLAERLHEDCDTFVTLPGLNSLYFWADKPPPTALNATVTTLLTDAQQSEVVAALDLHPRVMAVRHLGIAEHFWGHGRSPAPTPLVRCIDAMEVVGRRGGFELMVRPPSNAQTINRTSHDRDGP